MPVAPVPADEAARLQALHDLEVLDTPPEERFDRITRLSQRLFGVPMAFVNLVDADRLFTKSASGLDMRNSPREGAPCAHTIVLADGLVLDDAAADPRFRDMPWVHDDPRIRFYAGVPLEAPGGQRVGTLCIADREPRTLSAEDRAILRDLADWVEKELSLDEELERAAAVQRALLPARPPAAPGWDIAAVCRPSRDVGGDFFDYVPTSDGVLVTLGDVMGKGMPAAIVMATVRAAVRAAARDGDVGVVLSHAGAAAAPDLEQTTTFATVFLARLHPDGTASCADAGHGHALVVRADGSAEDAGVRGFPLGIDAGETYEARPLVLHPGDLLVVHSDGLLELQGAPQASRDLAPLVAGASSAQEAIDRLLVVPTAFDPPDDVTIVVVHRAS